MKKTVQIALMPTSELSQEIIRKAAADPLGIVEDSGKLYYPAGENTLYCDDSETARTVLRIAGGKRMTGTDPADAYRAFFAGSADTAPGLSGVSAGSCRSVIVFTGDRIPENGLSDMIRELAPLDDNDLLIAMQTDTAVLIRDGNETEAGEFALALIDTVDSETGYRLRAGIGNARNDPSGLRDSYLEALDAIRTGLRFSPDRTVYLYKEQMLDRLLDRIPPDARKEFRKTVFGRKTEKTLNDEMLATAETFLRSDLNLSDTARQMFIHRNTLTYRLDKIQKETGLDLRRFDDAVLFRILTELPDSK